MINLIYPLSCLLCRARLNPLSDKPLCEICWNKIKFNLPPFCRICAKHLPASMKAGLPASMKAGLPAKSQNHAFICNDCQASRYFFKKAHSVCIYEGVIKECIHLFKYSSKLSLSRPLAELMIDFAGRFLDMKKVDLILPVPLYSAKERQRQFNQAGLLSESLAKVFSKQMHNKTLIKIKATSAQINLSRTERLKNIKGAFKVKNNNILKNKNILLVDDVLTTGATVNECAKALHKAGANRIEVFTLARKA